MNPKIKNPQSAMWQPMGMPHVMLSVTSSRGSGCADVSTALADVSIDSAHSQSPPPRQPLPKDDVWDPQVSPAEKKKKKEGQLCYWAKRWIGSALHPWSTARLLSSFFSSFPFSQSSADFSGPRVSTSFSLTAWPHAPVLARSGTAQGDPMRLGACACVQSASQAFEGTPMSELADGPHIRASEHELHFEDKRSDLRTGEWSATLDRSGCCCQF